jgi:hypothetical protein
MGARVRTPDATPPAKVRVDICPHCGAGRRVINGAWLRWRRERAGIDQRTLAARLGISGPYLSDIERNRRACSKDFAALFQKAVDE